MTTDYYVDFAAVDRLRLEVQVEPPSGLVNLVPNPSGDLGGWGWRSPVANSFVRGTTAGGISLAGNSQPPAQHFHHTTEPLAVDAGQYVAARWVCAATPPANNYHRVRFEWLNAAGAVIGSAGLTGYLAPTVGQVLGIPAQLAPAGTVACWLRFDAYSTTSGGVPFGGHGTAVREVTVAAASTAAALNGLPALPDLYVDVLGPTHEIRVDREELNVGLLAATIHDATIDPAQADTIRPGRKCRVRVLAEGGAWESVFTGRIRQADVQYDALLAARGDARHAKVTLTAVDAIDRLTQARRPEGVAEIYQLTQVLEGAGVPWLVNGSTDHFPLVFPIVSHNDDASALDQIVVTRDSEGGYAWLDRRGVIVVDDALPPTAATVDEDDYSTLDLSFSTADVINEVWLSSIEWDQTEPGKSVEVTYGPYVDKGSIDEWGRYRAEFKVQGLTPAEIATRAAAILAANATPALRVGEITLPIKFVADLTTGKALLDLYSPVRVLNAAKAIDSTLRVTSLSHEITPRGWLLRLGFSTDGSVASPQFTPAVTSGGPPAVPDGIWQNYTPTDSGQAMTNVWGRWMKVGKTAFVQVRATVNRNVAGILLVTLPTPARGDHPTGYGAPVGVAFAHNPGVAIRTGVATIYPANRDAVAFFDSNSAGAWGESNYPWQWGVGDEISFQIAYELP